MLFLKSLYLWVDSSVRPLRHFCFVPFPFSEVFARCRTRQLDLHEDLHEKGTVLGNKMG